MTRYLLTLSFTAVVLAGCPVGGRYERQAGGGRFIGARPGLSPAGDRLAFSSPDTGHGDIYTYRIANRQLTRLTDNPNYEGDPCFSPDGRQVVFIREENRVAHLWIMNADGSGQRQLTQDAGYDSSPSFSPDGQRLVFTRYVKDWRFRAGSAAAAEIFVVNVDGTGETRLTDNSEADFEPSFSPSGRQILYNTWAEDVRLMDADGSNSQRLSAGASAAFSPDGTKIVFVSGTYGREISTMDADGGHPMPILKSEHYLSHPSYFPDGRHVLVLDEPDASGIGTIQKVDAADKSLTPIVSTRITQ